ncbi:hypothetical protein F511_30860 [Dorcoceras hygrometricum]|uniref:Cyclin-like domain-containing protein n=1 Tax=Dorcoceras hygrometricum TaxID=472368 RepID=A0A2Z7BZW5_9LAMI|nr:hypothetical protein F511_30860 [Dorcoceras hygrometricum]
MESLLCNEVWLMNSSLAQEDQADDFHAKSHAIAYACFYSSKPDFDEVFEIFLAKESTFMPDIGYSKLLESSSLISNARFPMFLLYLLESQRRMHLSSSTVFSAVNYLDRFISSTHECQGWKSWNFDLLSIACLSIASKLNESTTSPLSEFQMDNSQLYRFKSGLIQQMELTLLKTLSWRMDCTTPFSYIELLTCSIASLNNEALFDDLISRVTHLLLDALLDHRFSGFRPSVIAISAVRCIYENNASMTSTHFNTMIPQKHTDDLIKCQKMMETLWFKDHHKAISSGDSLSPVTVLNVEWYNCYDYRVDLSFEDADGEH